MQAAPKVHTSKIIAWDGFHQSTWSGNHPAKLESLLIFAWFLNDGDINMETAFQINHQTGGKIIRQNLVKGIGWGLMGGLLGTLIMDLVLMGILSAAGDEALSCFSVVGDTVSKLFFVLGRKTIGGVPMGVATHYTVGPIVGAIFGAAARAGILQASTFKKGAILGILYVEILSQPLLALTPLLLKTTASETLLWFSGSFAMHIICGSVLGIVVSYGLRFTAHKDSRGSERDKI